MRPLVILSFITIFYVIYADAGCLRGKIRNKTSIKTTTRAPAVLPQAETPRLTSKTRNLRATIKAKEQRPRQVPVATKESSSTQPSTMHKSLTDLENMQQKEMEAAVAMASAAFTAAQAPMALSFANGSPWANLPPELAPDLARVDKPRRQGSAVAVFATAPHRPEAAQQGMNIQTPTAPTSAEGPPVTKSQLEKEEAGEMVSTKYFETTDSVAVMAIAESTPHRQIESQDMQASTPATGTERSPVTMYDLKKKTSPVGVTAATRQLGTSTESSPVPTSPMEKEINTDFSTIRQHGTASPVLAVATAESTPQRLVRSQPSINTQAPEDLTSAEGSQSKRSQQEKEPKPELVSTSPQEEAASSFVASSTAEPALQQLGQTVHASSVATAADWGQDSQAMNDTINMPILPSTDVNDDSQEKNCSNTSQPQNDTNDQNFTATIAAGNELQDVSSEKLVNSTQTEIEKQENQSQPTNTASDYGDVEKSESDKSRQPDNSHTYSSATSSASVSMNPEEPEKSTQMIPTQEVATQPPCIESTTLTYTTPIETTELLQQQGSDQNSSIIGDGGSVKKPRSTGGSSLSTVAQEEMQKPFISNINSDLQNKEEYAQSQKDTNGSISTSPGLAESNQSHEKASETSFTSAAAEINPQAKDHSMQSDNGATSQQLQPQRSDSKNLQREDHKTVQPDITSENPSSVTKSEPVRKLPQSTHKSVGLNIKETAQVQRSTTEKLHLTVKEKLSDGKTESSSANAAVNDAISQNQKNGSPTAETLEATGLALLDKGSHLMKIFDQSTLKSGVPIAMASDITGNIPSLITPKPEPLDHMLLQTTTGGSTPKLTEATTVAGLTQYTLQSTLPIPSLSKEHKEVDSLSSTIISPTTNNPLGSSRNVRSTERRQAQDVTTSQPISTNKLSVAVAASNDAETTPATSTLIKIRGNRQVSDMENRMFDDDGKDYEDDIFADMGLRRDFSKVKVADENWHAMLDKILPEAQKIPKFNFINVQPDEFVGISLRSLDDPKPKEPEDLKDISQKITANVTEILQRPSNDTLLDLLKVSALNAEVNSKNLLQNGMLLENIQKLTEAFQLINKSFKKFFKTYLVDLE